MEIDAKGLSYKLLNEKIRAAINAGEKEIVLNNVNGQRYIGDNLSSNVKIIINGVPGNDLGFSLYGPQICVNDNAQDAVGNTMGQGKIVINGNVGDICGYAMRGGKIFIKNNAGYRVGIHMKEYEKIYPTIVIGGKTGDFLGEYMAGGLLIVLGLNNSNRDAVGNFCGTGMHGGKMLIRGNIPDWKISKEVLVDKLNNEDEELLINILSEYCQDLQIENNFNPSEFKKLIPSSTRPYGKLYVY